MKATLDIEPLVTIAEEEFYRLVNKAEGANLALAAFWTTLYGPNECVSMLLAPLNSMRDEFERDD